jgi:hypothetical protein
MQYSKGGTISVSLVKLTSITGFVALLVSSVIFAEPVTAPQTFHIHGTLKYSTGEALRGRVIFQGGQLSKSVVTDGAGIYEADLPVGVYTMTVQRSGVQIYRRPPFRVLSPISVTLNAIVQPVRLAVDRIGGPTSEERENASKGISFDGEDSFLVPGEDEAPFQLYIRYVNRTPVGETLVYTGNDAPPYENPVFVAYNLLTLQANKVIYDAKARTLETMGNVVVMRESGMIQRYYSKTFRIERGQAIP